MLDPVFSHLNDPTWLLRGKFFKSLGESGQYSLGLSRLNSLYHLVKEGIRIKNHNGCLTDLSNVPEGSIYICFETACTQELLCHLAAMPDAGSEFAEVCGW